MKKFIIITLVLSFAICSLFAVNPRGYTQKLVNDFGDLNGGLLLDVTNTVATTNPNYILSAYVTIRPTEIVSTSTHASALIRIWRFGNGTTQPYTTCAFLQFSAFTSDWHAGEVIHFDITHIPTGNTGSWELTIPDNTSNAIGFNQPINPIPQVVAPPWNILTITSDPTGQPVAVNGAVIPAAVTPYEIHHPVAGSVYTISNPAYIWNPASFTVPADFTYGTVNFVGTPAPANNYALTINAYKDGVEQLNVQVLKDGQAVGMTFVPITSTNVTDLTGVYSLATTTLTGGQFWDPATITVTAENFVEVPGGKGTNLKVASFGSKNGPKTDYAYTINFQMKTAYTLTINGPTDAATVGATAVTGPSGTVIGNIPITLVDSNDNINDLIGPYTIAALPTTVEAFATLGGVRKHWVVNPINVTEILFVGDAANITFLWRDYLARWDIPAVPELPEAHLFFVPSAALPVIDYGLLPVTLYYHGTKETWGEWKDPEEGSYYVEPEPETFDPSAPEVPPLNNPGPQPEDKISYTLTIKAYDSVTSAYVNVPITINGVPPSGVTTPYTCIDPVGGTVFSINDPTHLYSWTPENYTVPAGGLTEDTEITFNLSPYSPPLPVELTSFTALFTDQFYVQLTWISQSETNLLGYRMYRSEENSLDNALLITPTIIPATNTSQEHNYTIEDREVENHSTYYYWLESVDYNNSQFYGPVIVVVEGNVPPVMPEITTLKSAYPNPFRANGSTNIEVAIKAGETGTITIYNIMGQVVRTYKVSEGIHTIQWNGRDSQGNNCGSGIYFYKLTTPSLNQTKKMVIVK